MVLLHALLELRSELKIEVAVTHVNHNLRADSVVDADFVETEARRHQLAFFRKDCLEIPDKNIEAWGRGQRYDFFTYLLKSERYDWILTAHTASDQAETLLMKLFANRELQGIDRIDTRRKLIRPLLDFGRKQIEQYSRQNEIKFREDITNRDTEFFRNKIRHKVLPFLESELEGNLSAILSERADVINDDLQAIHFVVQQICAEIKAEKFSKEWKQQFKEALTGLPLSICWRTVENILLPEISFKVGRSAALRALDVFLGNNLAAEMPGGYRLAAKESGFLLSKI